MFQDYYSRHIKYIDIDLINLVNELIVAEKNRNKYCTNDTIFEKIWEILENRRRNWETYKLQANNLEAPKEMANVSDILLIQSELKPLVIGRESEKDALNNPSLYSSINFSKIEDNDFYTETEFKQENSFVKDNNISFIQKKQKEDDQSISNLRIQSIININKNPSYKSSQADEIGNNESNEIFNHQQENGSILEEQNKLMDPEGQTDLAYVKQKTTNDQNARSAQRDYRLNNILTHKKSDNNEAAELNQNN